MSSRKLKNELLDEDSGKADESEASSEDREEIESLGLGELSDAGFERLKGHEKPNEPKEDRKFIPFEPQEE